MESSVAPRCLLVHLLPAPLRLRPPPRSTPSRMGSLLRYPSLESSCRVKTAGLPAPEGAPTATSTRLATPRAIRAAPCTTANGCFRQLNQMANPGPYPPPDPGWIGEIMVDLDMISATCPDRNILLIEANTSNGSL